MDALEYFKKLDYWTNRVLHGYRKVALTARVRRHEQMNPIDEACFSQIELNRIIPNK